MIFGAHELVNWKLVAAVVCFAIAGCGGFDWNRHTACFNGMLYERYDSADAWVNAGQAGGKIACMPPEAKQ